MRRKYTINIPSFGFTRRGEVEWADVFGVAFSTLAFVIIAAITLSLTFHAVRGIVRSPGPPPKVITRTVYESGLTYAKQQFIHQCEQNEQSNSYSHGIPNVEVTPWTCVYAN